MNNLAVVLPFKAKKQLIQFAHSYMADSVGVYDAMDLIDAIEQEAQQFDRDALIKEACRAIGNQVIKARSTPHLAHNEDWVGYGELAIKLPETKLVNVRYAEFGALDIRKTNVIENRDQIVAAANLEVARIEKIQAMMRKLGVDVAGPALDVLGAISP